MGDAATIPRIDSATLVQVEGQSHTQRITTVRCEAPPDERDEVESHARRYGHRVAWAVALTGEPDPDIVVPSGGVVVYVDQEGREHPMRLHRALYSQEVRVQLVSGPLWRPRERRVPAC